MEALRESFLHLTSQMSAYKRATLDEEDLIDASGDIYPPSTMQVHSHTHSLTHSHTRCTDMLYNELYL